MDDGTAQLDYYVRAPARPAATVPPAPPASARPATRTDALRALAGGFGWRKAFRLLRWARVLLPLALLVGGGIWTAGAHAFESLPFVSSAPAHNLGADGRLDPISPDEIPAETALLKYVPTQIDASMSFLNDQPSLAHDLTGYTAARGIAGAGNPSLMAGAVTSMSVWPDAIADGDFREGVLDAVETYVGDAPEAISVGGMDAYAFHIERYPTELHGPDFVLAFYEDQIVQVAGMDERWARIYASEVLGDLP
jgi:hypothetical protein